MDSPGAEKKKGGAQWGQSGVLGDHVGSSGYEDTRGTMGAVGQGEAFEI